MEVERAINGTVFWVETLGCKATSHPAVASYLPVDMLFIDGDHSWQGISGDWMAWSDHIASDGIVALHDSINSGQCGSECFTQEVVLHDKRFEFIETIDTLTVVKRCYE